MLWKNKLSLSPFPDPRLLFSQIFSYFLLRHREIFDEISGKNFHVDELFVPAEFRERFGSAPLATCDDEFGFGWARGDLVGCSALVDAEVGFLHATD